MKAFEARSSVDLSAELRQIAAQSYLQLGASEVALALFIAATEQYVEQQSVNASICLANVFAVLSRQHLFEAAEFVALSSLMLPAACDAQIITIRALIGMYVNRSNWGLASASLVAASRYASARALALSSLLEMATRDPPIIAKPEAACVAAVTIDAVSKISFIVCSVNDARFDAFSTDCAAAFLGDSYEVIRINDAHSMCEGYNRGMAHAIGDILVFCHDDIEFLFGGGAARLTQALASADVICCVGADECVGPSWTYSPVESMQGSMAMPVDDGRYVVSIVGVADERRPLRTGDGCFIACRADVARQLRWDDATFTHFHMYDADFCIRASNAGFRVQHAPALPVSHRSPGAYDESWQEEAEKFNRKHGMRFPAVKPTNPWVATYIKDRMSATRCLAQLDCLTSLNWRNMLARRRADISTLAISQCLPLAALRNVSEPESQMEIL